MTYLCVCMWALKMCVWHLPYRNGPFHCCLCCHVKPVSETSLSLEVQTKHCSTRAIQTTAKLQTCMFMSDFLASNIETAVCAGMLYTHDYWMNLERLSRGKGDSSEYIRQIFGLVVTEIILITVFPPAKGFISSFSTEFTQRSFMEERNIPVV